MPKTFPCKRSHSHCINSHCRGVAMTTGDIMFMYSSLIRLQFVVSCRSSCVTHAYCGLLPIGKLSWMFQCCHLCEKTTRFLQPVAMEGTRLWFGRTVNSLLYAVEWQLHDYKYSRMVNFLPIKYLQAHERLRSWLVTECSIKKSNMNVNPSPYVHLTFTWCDSHDKCLPAFIYMCSVFMYKHIQFTWHVHVHTVTA